ncbi:serine/threonine-protein kinase 16 [Neocloeon triangulifer]|uniref:serine/threonine-protein kinase 16 n=1 Tax=Neocloeon triangulifer TaxID=2078957 RepID=UPI00286F98D1|nr:serine/threonine-protein kinase 16 [Neocloeon triangulifer]
MNAISDALLASVASCFSCGRRQSLTIEGHTVVVRKRLAAGGFSLIDLVEEESTGRLLALKRISCHGPQDEAAALREVQVHKQVRHPHLIDLVGHRLLSLRGAQLGPTSELQLLLPYYQRGSLAYELERRQQGGNHLSESLLLALFKQVTEAVQCLHQAGLAHRDIKPHNVLLDDDFSAILMDLGSATAAKVQVCGSSDACRLQDEAAEKSSMPYRAPELFNVDSYCTVDQRTDIWSLGCLIYAMAFYKSPFDPVYERGDSVALAVLSGNIEIPENSTYSQGLHELILSMLKVNASERPFVEDILKIVSQLELAAQSRV